MNEIPGDDSAAIVADFLRRLDADRDAGSLQALEDYQALYAGDEDLIARTWESIFGEGGDDSGSAAAQPGVSSATEWSAGIPDTVIGRHRLLRELGRGGQATVYLAEDTRLHRRVALKVLGIGAGLSESLLERFRREAEIASRLDHPGICPVYDSGIDLGTSWIAMRYVEGETLARKIASAREGGLPKDVDLHDSDEPGNGEHEERPSSIPSTRPQVMRVVQIIELAARALHAAHEAGVVHRDVKPGNIMITGESQPVILDFGLARDQDAELATLTRSGDVFGTPAYMSPEQLTGRHSELDRRTDVYSLGVTLYECLTLRRPFEAPTPERLGQVILGKDPPDPRKLNRSIPDDLRAIIEKALEKNRDDRYPTALALAEDLRRVRAYEPITARRAGAVLKLRRWVRRNPLAASFIAMLVIGLAISLYLLGEISAQKQQTDEAYRHSQALALSARAVQLSQSDPQRALELTLEALELERELPEALAVVHRSLAGLRKVRDFTTAPVWTAEVHPETGAILVACDDGSAQIWWPDGRAKTVPLGGARRARILSAVWSPDGSQVLTASRGGAARLYRVEDGEELRSFPHPTGVQTAVFHPRDASLILTGCWDGVARLWRVGEESPRKLPKHDGPVRASFSPRGDLILTCAGTFNFWRGFSDCTAKIWTLEGEQVGETMRHEDQIFSACWSPTGQRILTASMDGTARLWDTEGGSQRILRHHDGWVFSGVFSPDGERILTCSLDTTACLWDEEGTLIRKLHGHSFWVTEGAFSADGRFLMTAGEDATAYVWDRNGNPVGVFSGRRAAKYVWNVRFLEGEFHPPRLLTVAADGALRIWELWDPDLPSLLGGGGAVYSIAISPSGDVIATGAQDGAIRLWDREGRLLMELPTRHAGAVFDLDFSPDGSRLASASLARSVIIHDLEGSRESIVIPQKSYTWSVDFHPEKPLLVTTAGDRATRFHDLEGNPAGTPLFATHAARRAIVSPAGDRILTTHGNGVGHIWSLAGDLLGVLPGHVGRALGGCWTSDGQRVITVGADDGRILTWDPRGLEGKPLAEIQTGGAPLTAVALSPDERVIAIGHGDGSASLWSIDGRLLVRIAAHTKRVKDVCFTPEGEHLLTCSVDGTVRSWFVDPGDLLAHARERLADLADDRAEIADTRRRARHLDSLVELGNALRRRGRLDEAESLLRRVVARDPLRLRARHPLARILIARGDAAAARALMRSSCELEPLEPDAWYGLAWVHVVPDAPPELWDPAAALEPARRAVELTGEQKPAYLTLLGIVHYRLEQFDEAEQALRRSEAIQLRRDGQCAPLTMAFLAMVRHRLGDQDEALLLLEQVQGTLSNPAVTDDDARGALQEARALIAGAAPGR